MRDSDSEHRDETTVTVVIPAFNRETTIGRALESLRNQTYPHWTAIVVDDGSSDRTIEAARSAAREDPRITVIGGAGHAGAQAARNAGIQVAETDWIAFLDSDDEWYPESLYVRMDEADRTGAEVIHSAADVIENARRRPFPVPPMRGSVYEQLLASPGPMFQGLLVKKRALEEIGGLDVSIVAYQEWDTAIRLAKICIFGFVDRPTFAWHIGRSDAISADWSRGALGYQQVLRKHFSEILGAGGRKLISQHYSSVAIHYARAGRRARAIGHYVRAARWWPRQKQVYRAIATTVLEAATGKELTPMAWKSGLRD